MATPQELRTQWLIDIDLYGVLAYLMWVKIMKPLPPKDATSNYEVELFFQKNYTLIRKDSARLPFSLTQAKLGVPFQLDIDGLLHDCTVINYTVDSLKFSVILDNTTIELEIGNSQEFASKLVMKTPPLIRQAILTSQQSKESIVNLLTDFMLVYNINTSGDFLGNSIAKAGAESLISQMITNVHS